MFNWRVKGFTLTRTRQAWVSRLLASTQVSTLRKPFAPGEVEREVPIVFGFQDSCPREPFGLEGLIWPRLHAPERWQHNAGTSRLWETDFDRNLLPLWRGLEPLIGEVRPGLQAAPGRWLRTPGKATGVLHSSMTLHAMRFGALRSRYPTLQRGTGMHKSFLWLFHRWPERQKDFFMYAASPLTQGGAVTK